MTAVIARSPQGDAAIQRSWNSAVAGLCAERRLAHAFKISYKSFHSGLPRSIKSEFVLSATRFDLLLPRYGFVDPAMGFHPYEQLAAVALRESSNCAFAVL